MSYLERYTLLAATGCSTGEDDMDGNDARTGSVIASIQACKNQDELKSVYERELKLATEAKNINLQRAIIAAKDAKKKELA